MPKQDKELLLKRDEINNSLIGIVYDYEPAKNEQDYLDARFDEYKAVAQAQLTKARPIIEKQIIDLAIECDILCPEEKAIVNNCVACKLFWNAIRRRGL